MKETKSTPGKQITVADYITAQINFSGKSQFEIAKDCGFPKANMITMIKQGKSRMPISKIGLMAKSLGIDPIHFYKLVMEEYQPENWEVIQSSLLKQPVLTENELEIIEVIRKSNVINPKIRTIEEKKALLDFISTLKGDNQVAGD